MLISEAIRNLQAIQTQFGDIRIIGGYMMDDQPLSSIVVTDTEGAEVWPDDPNGVAGQNEIDGVFLTS